MDRTFLIMMAEAGRMSPEAAEAEAARLGLRKLADAPHPTEFDPMEEARWSLFMVLAWIVWRTPEAVRNQWDEYRIECEEWTIPEGGKRKPKIMVRQPASWVSILAEAYCSTDRLMNLMEARDALWRALGEQKLHATANPINSTIRRRIPSRHWADLGIHIEWVGEAWCDVVGPSNNANETPKYMNLDFGRTAVMSVWPPQPDSWSAMPAGDRGPVRPLIARTAGRPSSMSLVKAEYQARWDRGVVKASIGEEARELSQWLSQNHPSEPKLSWKTISNRLSSDHRQRMVREK